MQRQSAHLDESWSGVNMWKSDGSQLLGRGACAGGRMRGRAGAPADECGQVASMRALLAKARTGGPLPGGRAGGRAGDAMQMLRQACKKAGAGVPRIARNRPVHRLLRQKEDEAAPERFPGRATVSHGRPQLGGRKFAGARGSTCADPEDQQAENGIEIIEIHRAGRTEGLAPVGGRPPLLAASEPLFQYS